MERKTKDLQIRDEGAWSISGEDIRQILKKASESAEAKDAVGVHTLPHSEKSGLVGGASANSALSPSGATSHPTSCGKLSAPENALLKKKAENHNKKNHIKEGLNTPSKVKR